MFVNWVCYFLGHRVSIPLAACRGHYATFACMWKGDGAEAGNYWPVEVAVLVAASGGVLSLATGGALEACLSFAACGTPMMTVLVEVEVRPDRWRTSNDGFEVLERDASCVWRSEAWPHRAMCPGVRQVAGESGTPPMLREKRSGVVEAWLLFADYRRSGQRRGIDHGESQAAMGSVSGIKFRTRREE
jgi:hypothetical protein